MKLSLTVWERLTLIGVLTLAPATERTKPGVLAIQDIQSKLLLTDKEKGAAGYIELADGRATWADQECEAEIDFTNAEWYYVQMSPNWGGWPILKNSNQLWDKINNADGIGKKQQKSRKQQAQ